MAAWRTDSHTSKAGISQQNGSKNPFQSDVNQDMDGGIDDKEQASPCIPTHVQQAPVPPLILNYDVFLHALLRHLALSQDIIQNIWNAQLEDDIDDLEILNQLCNPLTKVPELDKQTQISIELFNALVSHPRSVYDEACCVFNKTHPDRPLHSYWVVKHWLEMLLGIT